MWQYVASTCSNGGLILAKCLSSNQRICSLIVLFWYPYLGNYGMKLVRLFQLDLQARVCGPLVIKAPLNFQTVLKIRAPLI